MPAPTPLLRARDVTLTHPHATRPTPRSVSFAIEPGEVVVMLGPSGSGKSTLTRALNGLIPHSLHTAIEGAVIVAGTDTRASTVPELAQHVGMVFQDPDTQIITGSILDEVAFGPENLQLSVNEVLRRSETALKQVDLWERRAENPDRLSGGGKQRLALACALALGSDLLVLDEPTANLDPRGIDDVYAALRDLVAPGDKAILLVEHNLDPAMEIATRVLVLNRAGELVFDGTPGDVIRDHVQALLELGVWLPRATLAALDLREQGVVIDPLPLTPRALRAALPPGAVIRTTRTQHPVDAPSVVKVRELSIRKQKREILYDVTVDIPRGSFTAIIGPNGAGKTTLIQAIGGVVAPPRGTVQVADLDAGRASPRELAARIGFVFQNPEHQFITQSVRAELAHGLRIRSTGQAEIDTRVDEMLTRFGLEEKADLHPFLLSGGEKRRLSVGTALITRPSVLALDEPTFGQDQARAAELLRLLREVQEAGTTVIIVTHDLQLVADYADTVILIADGQVVATGAAAAILGDAAVLADAGLSQPALFEAVRP